MNSVGITSEDHLSLAGQLGTAGGQKGWRTWCLGARKEWAYEITKEHGLPGECAGHLLPCQLLDPSPPCLTPSHLASQSFCFQLLPHLFTLFLKLKTDSYHVARDGLEFLILLPQLPSVGTTVVYESPFS